MTTSALANLWNWWQGEKRAAGSRKKRVFVRNILVSSEVRAFVNHDYRTRAEVEAFAELLLRLDGDPVSNSFPVLSPPVRGMRWAAFSVYKVILHFDPSHDLIRVMACE